jgi:DegV family protein with EDD domain
MSDKRKSLLKSIFKKEQDLDSRLFNIFMMAGIVLFVCGVISTVLSRASAGSVVMLLLLGLAAMLMEFQRLIYEKERRVSNRRQLELEEANRAQSRFFANMSHEIRTPINTIIGLNEMNLRENISGEIEENCLNIQLASRMLLSLVNDILDLSKIESGKMEIIPRQYETGVMLSELVNINWVRAKEKELDFKIDISPDIPSMLYGDDVRIKQVLTNIITNAIKYTPAGSITLQACMEPVSENRIRLIVSVSDTGMGIRKEDIPYLFSAFKRVDEKKNAAIEGTGLGLSICRQLVELMGGTITVDSIYRRGSMFTVSIEQEILDHQPIGEASDLVHGRAHTRAKYEQMFEAPEARVLIVDDNEMNRMVAKKLLRDTKIQVDLAESGSKCLEMTKNKFYHLIFMDHMMPQMDGIETLERLRRQENGLCRETPVIALTANAMSGVEEIYAQAGFQGYLVKPINGSLFEAIILQFLPPALVVLHHTAQDSEEFDGTQQIHLLHNGRKKNILVTTECVCDLPKYMQQEYGMDVIYYYVETQEGRFRDGVELSADNMIEYIYKKGKKAYSMPPSVEEYEAFFADALDKGHQIIHISMCKNGGHGYQTAVQAASGFDNVFVVDSGHLSSGMGLLALCAADMAKKGKTADDILKRLDEIRQQISTSFIVGSTESLYKSGRMKKSVKQICDLFLLHPVLVLKKSSIVAGQIYAGTLKHAYKQYIRSRLKGKKDIDTRILFFTYSGCSAALREEMLAEISRYQQFDRIVEQQASAAISSNCGLGTFGLLYMTKEKD